MAARPTPPPLCEDDALFLDFDGTLVDIAPRPELVIVTDELRELVGSVQKALDGALAMISGRPVGELDALLAPLTFAAAGEHGAEIRYRHGAEVVSESTLPEEAAAAVQALTAKLAGTQLELKRASASLHYRAAPEQESAVVAGMRELEAQLQGYALILGKMVAELKPENVDKGLAIRDLCEQQQFAGRRPVFVGDDVTDESGFRAVNELGGVSVCVGDKTDTQASYRLPDVAGVHDWLGTINKN